MTTCETCGAATKARFACKPCTAKLARDLQRLAELWPATLDTLTRQTKTGTGAGKNPGKTTPLPFDATASEVRDATTDTLTAWSAELNGPTTNAPTAARWLATNHDRIGTHEHAATIIDELTDTCRQIVRLVDRPESPTYLGTHACGADIWARSHHLYKTCTCGDTIDLEEVRDNATLRARQTWATARTICAAAGMFNVPINKMMISRWYRSGEIPPAAVRNADDGKTLEFRVGIVVDLARRHAEQQGSVTGDMVG